MDKNEDAVLFITELNHMGVVSDKIKSFLRRAKQNHPNFRWSQLHIMGSIYSSLPMCCLITIVKQQEELQLVAWPLWMLEGILLSQKKLAVTMLM